ncbi:MAG: hypothetical protein IKW47_05605, partial [Alistipes sp.]|nr:hypothetical protein [Alistipes sp.]
QYPRGLHLFCAGLLGYFEAARRLKKRSLLNVNEHFSGKADAKKNKQPIPSRIAPILRWIVRLF